MVNSTICFMGLEVFDKETLSPLLVVLAMEYFSRMLYLSDEQKGFRFHPQNESFKVR